MVNVCTRGEVDWYKLNYEEVCNNDELGASSYY